MKRKYGAGVIIIICLFTVGLIGLSLLQKNDNNTTSMELEKEYYSIGDVIQHCDVIVIGTYKDVIETASYREYIFSLDHCLYGSITDENLYVFEQTGEVYVEEINYQEKKDRPSYQKGHQYLLIMEKTESVLLDHDRFMTAGEVIFDITEENYTMYGEELNITYNEIMDQIRETKGEFIPETKEQKAYADIYEEMIELSPIIATVSILQLEMEVDTHNGNVYTAEIQQYLKGEAVNSRADGTISLVLLKGSVEVGKTYIIGFESPEEGSVVYVQSTKNSVMDLEQQDKIQSLLEKR